MDSGEIQDPGPLNKNERPYLGSFVFILGGIILIVIDQLVKYIAFKNPQWEVLRFLEPLARQENFRNYLFAFSLPIPQWLIFIVYGAVLYLIFQYLSRQYYSLNRNEKIAWVLVVAGALSNIGERIILGYVRDFIYIATGIFNIADLYILLGIIVLVTSANKLRPKT
jgi:signal peptidase II